MARGHLRAPRERLLQGVASDLAVAEVARTIGGSERTIRRYTRTVAAGALLEPSTSPCGPRKIAGEDEDAVHPQVAAHPDAMLAEHGAHWAAAVHEVVRFAIMSRARLRLSLPLKKRP